MVDLPLFQCSDPDKKPFTLPAEEAAAQGWGCLSPADWEILLNNQAVKSSPAMRAVKKEVDERISAHPLMTAKWGSRLK